MNHAWLGICTALVGCGTVAEQSQVAIPKVAPTVAATPAPAPPAEHTRGEGVAVSGIEGSMSSYDVRTTMERRSVELAACHEPRARIVPALHGTVEFAIAVDREGHVGQVSVRASDLGDRTLEHCISDLIRDTPFPRPHGGDAQVTWTMMLEPTRAGLLAESWETEQVARVIDKHLETLQNDCGVTDPSEPLDVTAYVNKRGRVVSAGVISQHESTTQDLDCIVKELRSWPMPKPKHTRFAKVSFTLASTQPHRHDRRR